MNIKILKEESRDLKVAYLLYFVLQAPFAYVGLWGYQLLYWMVTYSLYLSIFTLFGGGDTELDFLQGLGVFLAAVVLSVWPVYMFFALPNLVKKENLRLYGIMKHIK
ncbi:hypothetical protein SAMN06296241_3186 [Salinimicrobium sediminis]|uniref:Uncharacterized protein n=1 Tax=Salinimicrobium sediminis TaxID=1343891 RepID=A0A285X8I2_9FLAO|nr:hypothetical protein [Salinimicrobium sediminis]SOC81605.1 hypothetical protein SAMN06296241_3186 [Salinimicrobium sediminis]